MFKLNSINYNRFFFLFLILFMLVTGPLMYKALAGGVMVPSTVGCTPGQGAAICGTNCVGPYCYSGECDIDQSFKDSCLSGDYINNVLGGNCLDEYCWTYNYTDGETNDPVPPDNDGDGFPDVPSTPPTQQPACTPNCTDFTNIRIEECDSLAEWNNRNNPSSQCVTTQQTGLEAYFQTNCVTDYKLIQLSDEHSENNMSCSSVDWNITDWKVKHGNIELLNYYTYGDKKVCIQYRNGNQGTNQCAAFISIQTPEPNNPCTVQGRKVVTIPDLCRDVQHCAPSDNATNVTMEQLTPPYYSMLTSNPYFFDVNADTATTSKIYGYDNFDVGYSGCAGSITCHGGVPIAGDTTGSFTCPLGSYYDLYWHFTPHTVTVNLYGVVGDESGICPVSPPSGDSVPALVVLNPSGDDYVKTVDDVSGPRDVYSIKNYPWTTKTTPWTGAEQKDISAGATWGNIVIAGSGGIFTHTITPSAPSGYELKNICWYKGGSLVGTGQSIPTPLADGDVLEGYATYYYTGPWVQTSGGDVYARIGINAAIPLMVLQKMFNEGGLAGVPGVVNVGNGSGIFSTEGSGIDVSLSLTDWLVGDAFTQYTPPLTGFYKLFYEKKLGSPSQVHSGPGVNPASLIFTSLTEGSNPCMQLSDGTYLCYYTTDVFTSGNWLVGNNKVVVLIDGNLTITDPITLGPNGIIAVIASGNITIAGDVGQYTSNYKDAETYTGSGDVEGVYISDGSLIIEANNDQRQFIGRGIFVVDSVFLNRDLEAGNLTHSAHLFIWDPNIFMNIPDALKDVPYTWQEVTP